MIKELKMYTVICDGCGKDVCSNTDFSCWNDKSYLEDQANEDGWIKKDNEHYCSDCYEYDDNDNLTIKGDKQ